MKSLIIVFFILFAATFLQAQENLFDNHLRKLSIVLRGQNPTLAEYNRFRQIKNESNADKALEQASEEFVNSKEFALKFSNKVANLFRIFQSPIATKDQIDFVNTPTNLNVIGQFNVLNFLAREIFMKDLPWSELLQRTEYHSITLTNNIDFGMDPRKFFSALMPGVHSNTYTEEQFVEFFMSGVEMVPAYDKFVFPRNDLRIAGALTTPEFTKRYVSTGVNKNRKRAAAVFRTMLCNDMVAAIPVSKDGVDEEKKVALLGVEEYTEDDIIAHVKGLQVHGQNPECMKCHRQLDPMGELFGLTGDRLHPDPSPGALVFKSESGAEVNIPHLKGIGELGHALVQQDDFFSCQVRHFWKWVYGENRMLAPKEEMVLVNKFKELQMKPKGFVKYLVDQTQFYEAKTYSEAQIVTFGAYKTLRKCQSCHNVQDVEEEMQNVNWFDVIDNKAHPMRTFYINRSLRQLTKNEMPPPEAHSEFSDTELVNLTRWLKDFKTNFDGE